MRTILSVILLIFSISLFSQEQGRWVMNPLTGVLEYVSNTYSMGDFLINLGYDNNTKGNTLNTLIGYGNLMNDHSIAIGWNNQVGCTENFVLGRNIRCDADRTITIGFGPKYWRARMPGSIAFGSNSKCAILHVHSGHDMPNNGYQGNIGGVRIGWGSVYADGTTALEIIAHSNSASSTTILSTESDEWVIGNDNMTVSGYMATGYFESDHVPKVHSAAGDTSLLPVPLKIGDYFIDISARDVYISTGSVRGSWLKVN